MKISLQNKWIQNLIALCVFIALIFIPLDKYQSGVLLFGDTDLTYHFANNFFSFHQISVWNDYFQEGILDVWKFQSFFLKKVIFLLNNVINNLYVFSYLWYAGTYIFFLFSVYYLIQEVIGKSKIGTIRKFFISLLVSCFSFVNGIFIFYTGQTLFILALVMMNLFLIFFIKNWRYLLEHKKNNLLYLILMGIFFSESTLYLQVAILLIYSFLFIAPFFLDSIKRSFAGIITQVIGLGIFVAILNLGWLIPTFVSLFNRTLFESMSYDFDMGWKFANDVSKNIKASDLIRFKAYHVFNSISNINYLLMSLPFIILTYFLSPLGQLNVRIATPLKFLFACSIFLGLGIRYYSYYIYLVFWNLLPLFNSFRTIFKFSFIYLYISLIIFSIILAKVKGKAFFFVVVSLVIGIVGSAHLFFVPEYQRNMQQYSIPDYYFEIKQKNLTINDPLIGNVFLLPQLNWQYRYKWSNDQVDSMNIFPFFYGSGNLVNGAQYVPDQEFIQNDYLQLFIRKKDSEQVNESLSQRNIKFIVYQKDVIYNTNPSIPVKVNDRTLVDIEPSITEVNSLLNDELCQEKFEVGEIIFCRIAKTVFSPVLVHSMSGKSPQLNKSVLEYKKLDQSRYLVNLHQVSRDIDLVFHQTYHDQWRVVQLDLIEIDPFNSLNNSFEKDYPSQMSAPDLLANLRNNSIYLANYSDPIKFISESFKGSIQNENLPNLSFYKTWTEKSIEGKHQKYAKTANKWTINIDHLCEGNPRCRRNDNGTFDLTLVVEQDLQKYLIIGLSIASVTFVTSIISILWLIIQNTKHKR